MPGAKKVSAKKVAAKQKQMTKKATGKTTKVSKVKSVAGRPAKKSAAKKSPAKSKSAPKASAKKSSKVASKKSGGGGKPRKPSNQEAPVAFEAFCMKCREKRQVDGSVQELKNGRPAAKGSCPVCGTTVVKMLSNDQAEELRQSA